MIAGDIPFIVRDIKNEMPFHNDIIGKIPYTFKPMPKNIMDESHKVDNKFLNNHLCEIEEAVDKKLMDKTSFVNQQIKYHEKSGILNHDNFFHCDLATGTPISNDNFRHAPFLVNPYMVSAPANYGAELDTTDTGTGGQAANQLLCSKTGSDGIAGYLYNRIAYRNASWSGGGTGEIFLGVYSQVSSVPASLTSTTAELTTSAPDYSWQSLTEFALETNEVWLAVNRNKAGTSGEGSVAQQYKDITFGALPNPAGTGWVTGGTQTRTEKLGHSAA